MPQESDFIAWMGHIDLRLLVELGLDSSEVPDQLYSDWFDAGWTPAQAVENIIESLLRGD